MSAVLFGTPGTSPEKNGPGGVAMDVHDCYHPQREVCLGGNRMPVTISVIVPVYNSAGYLRTCLEHLRRSSFREYECIVVDDGSTDNSADVARESGVTVFSTGGRRGPAFARNLGAKSAKGEILFFIDADVCVSPNTLARVHANFE